MQWGISGPGEVSLPDNISILYVLDGGSLLMKLPWTKGTTYNDIYNKDIQYVIRLYGDRTIIVFDGYDGKPSTKYTTHIRRSKGKVGRAVFFKGDMKLNMTKEDFLLKLDTNQRFLEMLMIRMNNTELKAVQCRFVNHSNCN